MASKPKVGLTSSLIASQLRGWRGTRVIKPVAQQPSLPLELYEFEASPYCRLVREALTELDLDALILPCPKGGTRFRPVAEKLGGKQQFPFLHDPNTGAKLYESAEIIRYLAKTYGAAYRAQQGWQRKKAVAAALAASIARATPKAAGPLLSRVAGLNAKKSKAPEQPLTLYSFESSPYSRPVREYLCELEIPYMLRNFAKDKWQDIGPESFRLLLKAPVTGRNRSLMFHATGRTQVPYLQDPNTGVNMFESADILAYLKNTYAQ